MHGLRGFYLLPAWHLQVLINVAGRMERMSRPRTMVIRELRSHQGLLGPMLREHSLCLFIPYVDM